MAAEQHGVIGEISRGSSTATYARHRVRSSRSFRLRCVHRHASLKRKHGYARRSQNSSDSVSSNLRKEKDCGLGRDACAVSRRRGKRKQANQKHRCKQRAEFETKKRVRRRSRETLRLHLPLFLFLSPPPPSLSLFLPLWRVPHVKQTHDIVLCLSLAPFFEGKAYVFDTAVFNCRSRGLARARPASPRTKTRAIDSALPFFSPDPRRIGARFGLCTAVTVWWKVK